LHGGIPIVAWQIKTIWERKRKMLSKALTTIRTYMDSIESAKDELKKASEKYSIYVNNFGMELYRQDEIKIREALKQRQQQAIDTIDSEFENALKTIRETVSKPIPAEAVAAFEVIKTRKVMTAFEIKALLERFKDNYLASVTIYELADVERQAWGKDIYIPRADDLEARVNELYEQILDTLRNYSGIEPNTTADFTMAVMYEGKPINGMSDQLNEFVNYFGGGNG
jgi:hypothetical protein